MRYNEIVKLKEEAPRNLEGDARPTFYDATLDSHNSHTLDDTRKPKLTLKMINRLKKIRSTKNLEMSKKQELLGIMYGLGPGDEEEGF